MRAQRLGIGRVVALAVRDADVDHLALPVAAREGRVVALDPQGLAVADEVQVGVAHQDARQQPGFAQDLEAVADAEHEAAAAPHGARTASITAARPAMAPQRR